MRRGNKGEWSELYTFLKILSEGKLYAADENLNKIPDIFYPLIKILRIQQNSELEYYHKSNYILIEDSSNHWSIKMPVVEFKERSLLLLEKLKEAKGRSFAIQEMEDFLNAIKFDQLKASSTEKSDIRVKVHDPYTGMEPVLGFSIKSRLGGAPTLLNAGQTTNFIYKINGPMNDTVMHDINNVNTRSKIKDRLKAILNGNCSIEFDSISNKMFQYNLQVIDSKMPDIIGELLFYFFSGQGSNMVDLLTLIQSENPCKYDRDLGHHFYEYKIKNFLRDVALGMLPSKRWDGLFDATGGYIVVKEDGDVLCYHIYNHNEFQNYLLNNVKFETASSSRYNFGKIYKQENEYFLNLNLQLRFI